MYITLFTIASLALLATVIFLQVNKGYRRGLTGSLIDLGVTVLSLFAAIVVTLIVSAEVAGPIIKLLIETDFYAEINEGMPFLSTVLFAFLKMLVSIVIYVPVFFAVRPILSIIFKIIRRVVAGRQVRSYMSEEEEPIYRHSKRAGALIGIATGYIISLVLMMPFIGLCSVANDTVAIIDKYSEEDILSSKDKKKLRSYDNDICKITFGYCGADQLFSVITRTKLAGQTVKLADEIAAIKNFDIDAITDALENAESLDKSDLKTFESAVSTIDQSVSIKFAVAGVLSTAADSWLREGSFYGVERPTFGNDEIVDPFIVELLKVCRTTSYQTVTADMRTLLNVFSHLTAITDLLSGGSYDDLMDELSTGGTLGKIENELRKNAHMAPLADTLHDMTIRVVMNQVTESLGTETYEQFVTDISDALNNVMDENGNINVDDLTSQMQGYLNDYGIDVPSSVTGEISSDVAEKLEGKTEITADDIDQIFKDYLAGADIGDLGDLEGLSPEDLEDLIG